MSIPVLPFWLMLVIAGLATYRLARMLSREEGPWSLFLLTRKKIDPEQKTWIGRGIRCPLCLGFWVGIVLTPFLFIPYAIFLLVPFALSAISCFMYKVELSE